DLGADLDAVVQVDHVVIDHADASGGRAAADGRGRVGAVDAVEAAAEIHGARAERIGDATGHEARQIGRTGGHLRRRRPIGPLRFALDRLHAGPGETLAADADAVTNRLAAAEDVIEVGVLGIDDDRARRLIRGVVHGRPAQVGPDLVTIVGRGVAE